jgi:hypothetical protein
MGRLAFPVKKKTPEAAQDRMFRPRALDRLCRYAPASKIYQNPMTRITDDIRMGGAGYGLLHWQLLGGKSYVCTPSRGEKSLRQRDDRLVSTGQLVNESHVEGTSNGDDYPFMLPTLN